MEIAGAVLGAVATADICLRLGRNLVERYNDYSNARKDIAEQRLRIQISWMRAEQEITLLQNTAKVLGEELQMAITKLLCLLEEKLEKAAKALTRSMRSGKLAFLLKRTLEDTVGQLEKWLELFQPIWFLIARTSDGFVDQALESQMDRVNLQEPHRPLNTVRTMKGIRDAVNHSDRGPSVWLSPTDITQSQFHDPTTDYYVCEMQGRGVVVDSMPIDPQRDIEGATKDVRDLARVLAMSDPTIFGILACKGIVVRREEPYQRPTRFEFVFEIPAGLHSPRRLRSILQQQHHARHSLDERVNLARHLSRSVVFVHSSGFVHKNIRPETIIAFQRGNQNTSLGVPFLVGFEMFRAAEGRTYLTGDEDWEKNLYRHPSRQGNLPEDAYNMQHDIYSLGVCLLEIGLWSPFVVEGKLGHILTHIARHLKQKDAKRKATDIKRELVQMAEERLPSLMGWKYTNVVLLCLTCLDKDGSFGHEDEFRDKDGIIVGVRYIEKVLGTLDEIVV